MSSEKPLVTILFLILPLLYFIFKKFKSQKLLFPLPPGPNPWPILSTINEFLYPTTHVTLANLARSYGPLMHLRHGSQHLIVASSPTAALEILKTNDHVLSARFVPAALPLTPSEINKLSVWADPSSQHWRNIRRICRTKLFSTKAVESQTWLMDQKVVEMVERLKLREGLVTNVERIVFATVVNIFSNVVFSRDLVRLDDEFRCDELRGIIRGMIGLLSSPNLANFYPIFVELDLQGLRKKYRELSMKMWAFWETILKEARDLDKGEFRQFNFLDSLLSRGFGDDQINQLLEELFTAGMDTTTSTIKRTMMEVISRPESMTKLKHELDSTSINHTNTSQVENLPYLQACVKETLRLHPPAPLLLSHRALETCQVMNYTVPKNARVLVNVWAIGRDPEVWEEPMEYKPERFLGLSMDFKGNDFKLLPFGSGRRICPGMPMAAKIVPSIVASLVYFFDWSSLHGTTHVDEMSRAASRITDPLLLIPRARKLSINSR